MIEHIYEIPEEKYERIHKAYDFVEKFLGGHQYITGSTMTIADFSFITTITSLEAYLPVKMDQYPNIYNWIRRMQTLPYYEECNGVGSKKFIELVHKIMQEHKH